MKEEDKVNLAELSDEQLIDIRNKLEMEYGAYLDDCASEVAELKTKQNIDLYSYFGEKKMNKIIKKYVKMTDGLDLAIEKIEDELKKRDNYKFERSFHGGKYYDDVSEDEFFEKESLKTLKYKQSIEAVKDEEDLKTFNFKDDESED